MADIISPLADVSRFQPTVKPFLKPLIEVQERQLPLLTGGNGPPIGVVEDSIPLNLSKEVDKIRSDALANIRYFKSNINGKKPLSRQADQAIKDSLTRSFNRGVMVEGKQILNNALPMNSLKEAYNDTRLLIKNPKSFIKQNSFKNPDAVVANLRAATDLMKFVNDPVESIGAGFLNYGKSKVKQQMSKIGLGRETGIAFDLLTGDPLTKAERVWNELDRVIPVKDTARKIYKKTVAAGLTEVEKGAGKAIKTISKTGKKLGRAIKKIF